MVLLLIAKQESRDHQSKTGPGWAAVCIAIEAVRPEASIDDWIDRSIRPVEKLYNTVTKQRVLQHSCHGVFIQSRVT